MTLIVVGGRCLPQRHLLYIPRYAWDTLSPFSKWFIRVSNRLCRWDNVPLTRTTRADLKAVTCNICQCTRTTQGWRSPPATAASSIVIIYYKTAKRPRTFRIFTPGVATCTGRSLYTLYIYIHGATSEIGIGKAVIDDAPIFRALTRDNATNTRDPVLDKLLRPRVTASGEFSRLINFISIVK